MVLRYLSFMGPVLLTTAKNGTFDRAAWTAETAAADERNLDQTLAVIQTLPEVYGRVLGGHAAYRTQLFMYLKACGQEHLGTVNLWRGADAVPA